MSSAIVMTETGGPEVLKLRSVAMPIPGPNQVCIEVRAIGVNPVETYWRAGSHGRNPKLPYTPGNDASGVVHAVGSNVKTLKPGDRVFTSFSGGTVGTYAHHCLVDKASTHKLPDNASFEEGASLGTSGLAAYRGLFTRGEARPGDRVLVHGATGGVGVVAVQLAVSRGMQVVGTADDEDGARLVLSLGATHAFIHNKAGYFEEVLKYGPYNVIIECLANVNLARDLEAVATRGRVVVIGSRGKVTIDPRDLMMKEADIRGVFLSGQSSPERDEAVAGLVGALTTGAMKPVVAAVIPLEQAPEAHRRVVEPSLQGKIILRPRL